VVKLHLEASIIPQWTRSILRKSVSMPLSNYMSCTARRNWNWIHLARLCRVFFLLADFVYKQPISKWQSRRMSEKGRSQLLIWLNETHPWSQLHSIILEAAKQSIPSLPSEKQQEHVKNLQKIQDSRRKQEKTRRHNIKAGRNSKWGD